MITRGTTGPGRLRRVDRWLLDTQARALRLAERPLVVDLGYGANPVTTVALHRALARVRPDVEVVGLEIDPARVALAQPWTRPGLAFEHGGFELGGFGLGGRRPTIVRAFNVLRQYDEADVDSAWDRMCASLAPQGALVEGTCDEVGRLAAWVTLDVNGPRTLTLAASLRHLERPGDLAARLPKALIHHNVPGQQVHRLFADLDCAWAAAAALGVFSARQRWVATVRAIAADWPVLAQPRWPFGELTVAWASVAPR